MAELRCFPIIDGKLKIDFSNEDLINKAILYSFDNNKIDNLLKLLVYFKLEFLPLVKMRDENILIEFCKDDLLNFNSSEKIIAEYKILKEDDDQKITVAIPDIFTDVQYSLNLLKDKDFDYQKKNNTHRITLIKNDKIVSFISGCLSVSLMAVYFKELNL